MPAEVDDDKAACSYVSVSKMLFAFEGDGAGRFMSDLREAAGACASGLSVDNGDGPAPYATVKELTAPRAGGDESLSYQVDHGADGDTGRGEDGKTPHVFGVVRKASVIAVFHHVDHGGHKRMIPPTSLLAAQVNKLP
ncbi:hypothetical protein [Streptomyces luteolus]|uniref:Uncharacterized protein n=1 Tax=Streptomyces luteolus TaxID=3043615 RepID=A0ABT6SWK5_9ACTN|nr:hypothetical protein [Streptomyces sp. B-S-A12]MDI3419970.1 hypothetical protein [Streptomyces sp. B-S-A12]